MKKLLLVIVAVAVALLTTGAALADDLPDPVGFCKSTGTTTANASTVCQTGTGLGNETIAVGTTSFDMYKNGNGGTYVSPWYLLVAVPEATAGSASQPVISSSSFAAATPSGWSGASVKDAGAFSRTQSKTLYQFVGSLTGGLSGDSSMSASNMFCDGNGGSGNTCTTSNEINAFGSEPQYFEIFVYAFTPHIANNTLYTFNVGGNGLKAGTFLAGDGGSNPFSTPYTMTGLAKGSGNPVPEPASLFLTGTGLAGIAGYLRRRYSI